jgi:hypothetical protein
LGVDLRRVCITFKPASILMTANIQRFTGGVQNGNAGLINSRRTKARPRRFSLFPEFITPKPYHEHWKSLGVRIEPIGGVFGRPTVSREEARSRMGIPEGAPAKTVYVLGGGTSIWDKKLSEIIPQLKEKVLPYNVVIFDRNAKPNEYVRVGGNVFKGGAIDGANGARSAPGDRSCHNKGWRRNRQ